MGKKTWAALATAGALATTLLGTTSANAADYGPYAITNVASGRCLDANGPNGTRVQLWDCSGSASQQWYLRYVSYGSEYQLVNRASGRCLDAIAQWNGVNGTPAQLWDCLGFGQLNQNWYVFQEDGNGNTTIQGRASNRVLDAQAQSGGLNGTPTQLWDDLGAGQLNQRWRL